MPSVLKAAAEYGLNFAVFHPAAVLDQVQIRARLLGLDEREYVRAMGASRLETEALRRAVSQTSGLFYRDAPAWDFLEDHVRKVWSGVGAEVQIRAWVPNCGAGEDAYTLAMLMSEILGCPDDLSRRVQIIATDVDESALDRARLGRYPASALSTASDIWRKRYFDLDRGLAQIHSRVREAVVFARHDLAVDPVLARMNIVVCRDLLRYYTPEYQFSLVGSLYSSLEAGGVLLLDPEDDLAKLQSIFRCESRSKGVFSRPGTSLGTRPEPRHVISSYRPDGVHLIEAWTRASLSLGVIVDSDDRIVEVIGRLEDSRWVRADTFDGRLATLLEPDLLSEVREVVATARRLRGTAGRSLAGNRPCAIRATSFETTRGELVGLAILDEPSADLTADTDADSSVDPLTGLLSRAGFLHELSLSLPRGNGICAVLWIDLDHFSEINDVHGHDVGDGVLCLIADRLRDVCGRRGVVGRIGSDQFGVVLCDVMNEQQPRDFAASLRLELRKPLTDLPSPIRLTASIGMVLSQDKEDPARAVLAAADRAMYAAKGLGGDRIQVSSVVHDEGADERFRLRQELAEALNNDALQLHYQPIFDVRNRCLWGVEALLRWHTGGRILPAGAFIDAAQQTGQIREIGARVVELIARDWPRLESLLPESAQICMNMSVPEIEDPDLLDRLQARLDEEKLARLVVEVTESAILGDEREAVAALELLRSKGVRISLDDFGTGYSNLATLAKVPPDVIKADRSFLDMAVAGLGQRSELLRTVRAIAGAFKADAVAEGVSSTAHLEMAVEAGFTLVQGFDIAMPSDLDQLRVTWD